MSKLLYISMIGESDVYTPSDSTALCPCGLEKEHQKATNGCDS